MGGQGCSVGQGCWGQVGVAGKHTSTMPDVAGGWVGLLFGTLGGNWGRKLYISGVAGYNTPIWDVFAPQGKWEEAGERLCGAKLINFFPIRKAVPVGLAWARFCC